MRNWPEGGILLHNDISIDGQRNVYRATTKTILLNDSAIDRTFLFDLITNPRRDISTAVVLSFVSVEILLDRYDDKIYNNRKPVLSR